IFAPDIGPLQKQLVERDGTGPISPQKEFNPTNVTSLNRQQHNSPTVAIIPEGIKDAEGGENYWFYFNAWLSKQQGDKQMSCEAVSSTENGTHLQKLMGKLKKPNKKPYITTI
ncbi:unnamed protein product, partial [Trichobilharzia regenti]